MMIESAPVLRVPIHRVTPASAAARIADWASRGESRYVCVTSAHGLMEAHDAADFRAVLCSSALNVPDGRPLVWMQGALGAAEPQQVRGTDLMRQRCQRAARDGIPIGLYGGRPEVLERLADLPARFPGLQVAYRCSPPFRALTPAEDETVVRDIGASGCRLLLVGL